jgi:hypothetical protein
LSWLGRVLVVHGNYNDNENDNANDFESHVEASKRRSRSFLPASVVPNLLDKEECEHFGSQLDTLVKNGASNVAQRIASRMHGSARVSSDILQRIRDATGKEDCANQDEDHVTIPTSLITASTVRHVDRHREDGTIADEQVAFVFLNDNKDASFVIGDEKVPVISGNMIMFNGNVEHNTVVKSGVVRLLGPFAVSSFKAVGNSALTPILYGVDVFDAALRTIDPYTASTISTITMTLCGYTVLGATGLATHPVTQELYALLKVDGFSSRFLVTINPADAVATLVGDTGEILQASPSTVLALSLQSPAMVAIPLNRSS